MSFTKVDFLKLWGPRRYFNVRQFGDEPYFSVLPELIAAAPREFRTVGYVRVGDVKGLFCPSETDDRCNWSGDVPPRGTFDLADDGHQIIVSSVGLTRNLKASDTRPGQETHEFYDDCNLLCVTARAIDLDELMERPYLFSNTYTLLLRDPDISEDEEEYYKSEFSKLTNLIPVKYDARRLTLPLKEMPKRHSVLQLSDEAVRDARALWSWLEPRLNFPGLRTRGDIPIRSLPDRAI